LKGQKTGFFVDQRENRCFAGKRYAKDRSGAEYGFAIQVVSLFMQCVEVPIWFIQ